ncbi:MAG: hypothetical protein ACYCXF_08435 [Thermoleophilia bacterium]
MRFLKQLTRYLDGSRPAGLLFIGVAVALSALVAGASTYLFMAAGRSQLPLPVESEIMAPLQVASLSAITAIQTAPAVEATAALETIISGPFLVVPVTQPAGNESVSVQPAVVASAKPAAAASAKPAAAASAATVVAETAAVASTPEKSLDSFSSMGGLIAAQIDDSYQNHNGYDHGSRENSSGSYHARSSAHQDGGSKQERDRVHRRGK